MKEKRVTESFANRWNENILSDCAIVKLVANTYVSGSAMLYSEPWLAFDH